MSDDKKRPETPASPLPGPAPSPHSPQGLFQPPASQPQAPSTQGTEPPQHPTGTPGGLFAPPSAPTSAAPSQDAAPGGGLFAPPPGGAPSTPTSAASSTPDAPAQARVTRQNTPDDEGGSDDDIDDLVRRQIQIKGEIKGQAKTTYRTAYILLLTLGWLGAHRYYLRRWVSALVYTCTFGFFGLGVLADLLLTFFLVRERRAEEMGIELKALKEEDTEEVAWVSEMKRGVFERVEVWSRLGLLFFLPPILVSLAIMTRVELLVVLTMFLLMFSFIMGSIDLGLTSMDKIQEIPIIARVPLLPAVLTSIRTFQNYYSQYRPRSVYYYLFFPIVGLPMMMLSKAARRDFRPYWGVIALLAGGQIASTVLSYQEIYPPYLDAADASGYVFAILLFVFLMATSFTMPTVSSCFYLSLTGRQRSLRVVAGIAAVFTILVAYITYTEVNKGVSLRGAMTLGSKLSKENFRNDIEPRLEMFLQYYQRQKTKTPCKTRELRVQYELTGALREHLASQFRHEEVKAFFAVNMCVRAGSRPWLSVLYSRRSKSGMLFATLSRRGRLVVQKQRLPAALRSFLRPGVVIQGFADRRPRALFPLGLLQDVRKYPPPSPRQEGK